MRKRISTILLGIFLIGLLLTAGQASPQTAVLAAAEKACPAKVMVTANNLNVRANSNTQSSIIDVLKGNEVVNVLGQNGNWYIIKTDDGKIGSILKWFTKPVGQQPAPQQPAPQQPAPQQPAPQQPAPQQPAPQQPAPQQPAPQQPSNQLSYEQSRMMELVNAERTKAGLKPLTWDADLARVANIKAKDMVDNNYFSHTSPTYGSPFDMMRSFGIQYRTAGENLAGYSSVEGAHNGLMNSEGHRRNILNPSFTHIGIGVQKSPRYGYVFVQMFVGR